MLEENDLKASETLFVDDLEENTEAAQKLGIQIWNLIPREEDVIDINSKKKL